jgi:hypothetical protein
LVSPATSRKRSELQKKRAPARKRIARKNETLEQDLEMARELQQAMLPHRDFLDEDVLFISASKPNRGAHEERMKLT